jgi:hypothetical protein
VLTAFVVYRLVLAHENEGYPLGQFTKDATTGVHMVPDTGISESGLWDSSST